MNALEIFTLFYLSIGVATLCVSLSGKPNVFDGIKYLENELNIHKVCGWCLACALSVVIIVAFPLMMLHVTSKYGRTNENE